VAAAVEQGRADWGMAIEPVTRLYQLGFTPSRLEQYDFAIPADRWNRPAVVAFRQILSEPETHQRLDELGFIVPGGKDERR
jgi:putative molybdopterin biosynthesis protein